MNQSQVLDISWGTIFKVAITLLVFYILYLIRDILIWVIFALVLSILFNPAINFLQKRKIPRSLAAISVYILAFGIFGFLIYLISPPFISEIQNFLKLFPQYFEKISPPLRGLGIKAFENLETFILTFQEWLTRASANIFSAILSIFGGIFSTFTIFTLAIFFSLEEKGVEKLISLLSPKREEPFILDIWQKSESKVSGWFGVRILGCLFVALSSFFALWLLKIKYPFALSLFAGLTDIVPAIGPIIAGLIIFVIAGLDSWFKAFFILIIFILIQQIEGNILTPILTKKFIALPPVLVLIALMVGGKLWGILGAILAIPIVGIIFEFLKDFLKKRKEAEITPKESAKRPIVW